MDTESSQPYLLLVITLNYKKLCAQGYAITKEADKGNQRPGPGEELSNLKNCEKKKKLFKLASPWYFVIAAQAGT